MARIYSEQYKRLRAEQDAKCKVCERGCKRYLALRPSRTAPKECHKAFDESIKAFRIIVPRKATSPTLADLLTPEYATYLLDRICDGQSSPPWSDCMKGGCDQCDGPGTENCHPFCDALQKLAEKGK